MKNYKGLLISLVLMVGLGSLVFHRDVPPTINTSIPKSPAITTPVREHDSTITIDGIDYYLSGAKVGKHGGEPFLTSIGEGPKTFNPLNAKDATSSSLGGVMYDGLLTTNPITGEVVPLLAKNFKIENETEYTITLRNGLTWSDGKPITADDVIYTYKEIIFAGLGNTSTRDMMVIDGKLPKLEKLDDYTVKFTTSKPFAPFLRQLSTSIAPKHIFKPISDKGQDAFNTFMSTDIKPETLVTSGAFRLKEYIPAQRVVLERNPNYYKIDKNHKQLPYLDKINCSHVVINLKNNTYLQ
jgi:peptide/nickel transport system substrate-binding protein